MIPRITTAARLLAASAAFAVGAALAMAQEHGASDESAKAVRLVRQLGDPSFRAREKASRAIVELGPPAKPALLAALSSPDAEVRRRAQQALAAVWQRDWHVQIQAFVADVEGTGEHDLPGWERFQQSVGTDAAARRLFVEMLRTEPELMQTEGAAPAVIGQWIEVRCRQIQESARQNDPRQREPVDVADIAALLFMGGRSEVPVSEATISYICSFFYQPQFVEAVRGGGPYDESLRSLLGAWVGRKFQGDVETAKQNLMLALRYDLKEGLPTAIDLLNRGGASDHVTQYAILAVGKLGGPEHIDHLLPYLDDTGICGSQTIAGDRYIAQIRDVALAVILHLADQSPADYGFQYVQDNPITLFTTPSLGFVDDEQRAAALAKWNAFAAAKAAP